MSNYTTNHRGRRVLSGLTALGSSQTTAYPLLNGTDHEFTTVAASTGAILPAARLADSVTVWNGGANALLVYPPANGQVNAGGANVAYSLAAAVGITFFATDLGTWYTAGVTSVGTGTVTSVSFTGDGTVLATGPTTPVTTSGTLAPALVSQAANRVLAGPTTGSPAAPTFRALGMTDMPAAIATIPTLNVLANTTGGTAAPAGNTLSAVIDAAIANTQGDILYRGASAWSALAPGTSGQVLATQGASANPHWINAGGSVTSVAATVPVDMAVAGSPITTSGTLAITRVGPPSTIFDYTFYGGV
jgi:hypothetical protein